MGHQTLLKNKRGQAWENKGRQDKEAKRGQAWKSTKRQDQGQKDTGQKMKGDRTENQRR